MKVTYIQHSSFAVEFAEYILLFDYFSGTASSGCLPEFDPAKKLFVLASHKHPDHFDLGVLKLAERYPQIQFVFSKDIRLSEKYLEKNNIDPMIKDKICFMKPFEEKNWSGLQVETLLSTDEGVAFLVTCDDLTIYHAGDLNWWHWEGEEASFNLNQEKVYQEQIHKLQDRKIDLAFVVLDGRLKEQKYWGIEYFLEHVKAVNLFPMHLWGQYQYIDEFKRMAAGRFPDTSIFSISRENQVFEL